MLYHTDTHTPCAGSRFVCAYLVVNLGLASK